MMKKLCRWLAIAAIAACWSAPAVASPAGCAAPELVAANRCNDQTINTASSELHGYEQRGAAKDMTDVQQRFGEILGLFNTLKEERTILESVCSTDAERAPLFAEIAVVEAQALLLEANLAARMNESCPQAAQAIPSLMLADAWLGLANVVNDRNGNIPANFKEIIPKVQAAATNVSLALPGFADTSAYWRDQIRDRAKTVVSSCSAPAGGEAPQAAPSATASPVGSPAPSASP